MAIHFLRPRFRKSQVKQIAAHQRLGGRLLWSGPSLAPALQLPLEPHHGANGNAKPNGCGFGRWAFSDGHAEHAVPLLLQCFGLSLNHAPPSHIAK